jgi:transmembrane sensor
MAERRSGEGPAQEAAGWYVRLHAKGADAQVRSAFAHWRDADPAHAEAWASIERAQQALTAARHDPAVADMLLAARRAPPAAAANDAPRHRWWAAAAAAAVVACAGGAALYVSQPNRGQQVATGEHYTTGIGETRAVRLGDGSVLTLDAASAARVRLGERREVTLEEGRAFFKVAKDPAHPFVVEAGKSSVTALGTQFGVSLSGQRTTVSLVEGSVRVAPAPDAPPIVLRPGDVLKVHGAKPNLTHGMADETTRWRTGELVFDRTPLAEVADTLNRYSARKLVLRGDALRDHPFSGVLRTGEGPDALAEALDAYGLARVAQDTPDQLVLVAR